MFVWRKRAGARWLAANEVALREIAGEQLAIIQEANLKTATVEIAGTKRRELERICARFGGTIERLPRDWLRRFQNRIAKPTKIGRRLVILRSRTGAIRSTDTRLIIPADAAFGTGEHATTAMSLRLLEAVTRSLGTKGANSCAACLNHAQGISAGRRNRQAGRVRSPDWSMLDLGTGSGILALAARNFGARRVVAIDSDPVAISVAKGNARLNRIRGIDFRTGEARKFSYAARFDVVSANLYSELLIEILPKLKRNRRLIFSGILREQEAAFLRELRRNGIAVMTLRHRGKWIALLCAGSRISG